MNIALYILIPLMALLIGLLMLRLRISLYLLTDRKSLFAGLGRSGVEIDLSSREGEARLFGFKLKNFRLEEVAKRKPKEKAKPEASGVEEEPLPEKPKRERDWRDMVSVARLSVKPLFSWLVNLLKATRFEELRGDIRAGFDSPDLTGQTYGYYNALVGAVPALHGRLNYYPDWDGGSFAGELRASLAMPLYSLVGRTVQLIVRLPLRKIINLAIGTKKVGDPNAK